MNGHIDDEQLARLVSAELNPTDAERMHRHIDDCAQCSDRVQTLTKVDELLASLPVAEPSATALLDVRRELARENNTSREPEILTLEEVAEFLRLSPEEFGEIAPELPAFELGGRVRVRRSRLLTWIEEREQRYRYTTLDGRLSANRNTVLDFKEGVA